MVCIDDRLIAVGFRKMVSLIKSIHSNTECYFLTLSQSLTPLHYLFGKYGAVGGLKQNFVREIAEGLADADVIGFSSMTSHAEITKNVIREIKAINPKAYIIWGGIHPIMEPADSINHANAICTGEGEFAFPLFWNAYKNGNDFYQTKNFWFNKNGEIIRNGFLPIAMGEEIDRLPIPHYGEDEFAYTPGKGFRPMTSLDYLKLSGICLNTVWSIGCPYKCSYCGNTVFIENDKDYRKIRHPSVDYIIRQVKDVLKKHPFVTSISFHDDSFMAIPKVILKEFAEKWKREIHLPFCVYGVIPSFVKEDKFEILVEAGMNRVRMGIQSGSDRILKFYERPNKPGLIHHAASIINKFSDYMVPPSYDLILDNPIEERQDIVDTLELLYNLPRPFTLNIFSLRVIKHSVLERQLLEHNVNIEDITQNYVTASPTLANIMIYLLAVFKPPRRLFDYFLKYAKPYREEQTRFPLLILVARFLWLFKRGTDHFRFMDFSLFQGNLGLAGWVFWKIGLVKFWQSKINKSFSKPPSHPDTSEESEEVLKDLSTTRVG